MTELTEATGMTRLTRVTGGDRREGGGKILVDGRADQSDVVQEVVADLKILKRLCNVMFCQECSGLYPGW